LSLSYQVTLPRQPLLQLVEAGEQGVVRRLVRLLGGREAAAIDAVVDVAEHVAVDRVDLRTEVLGVELRGTGPVVRSPLSGQV
jgi:hypothetical protein